MDIEKVLHMNGGDGKNSYSKNSSHQRALILKVKPILQETVKSLYCTAFPETLTVADLGCSSGPNALLPILHIIQALVTACRAFNRKAPMLQVFLNDLPGNDFNNLVRLLPSFYGELDKEMNYSGRCFVAAMPGSFHGRLFPDSSVDLFHSCYSIQYLSQIPDGLQSESGAPLNKGAICAAKLSPLSVRKAYLDQYENDCTNFFQLRAAEMKSGGRMVHIVLGRTEDMDDPSCEFSLEGWDILGRSINNMVLEGLVPESLLDSFNLPAYLPTEKEIKRMIEKEGSFEIVQLKSLPTNWDFSIEELVTDKHERAKQTSSIWRPVIEPMLINHFGDKLDVDDLFERFARKLMDHLEKGTGLFNNLIVSLVKK